MSDDRYGAEWAANMGRKYKKAQLIDMVRRAFMMFEDIRKHCVFTSSVEVDEISDGFDAMKSEAVPPTGTPTCSPTSSPTCSPR